MNTFETNNQALKHVKHLAITALALLHFSCSNNGEQFYVLNAAGSAPSGSGGTHVGIGPVRLPEYIDREEIVFQSSTNKIEVPTKQLWAGPLDKNVTRVLTTNVARELRSSNVVGYPWPNSSGMTYQVTVNIDQFHSRTGGDAILEASWRVHQAVGGKVVRERSEQFSRPVTQNGYEGIAAAQSLLLQDLAEEIAQSLR